MSLRYSLLGIPKTFEEFLDKAQRRGISELEIALSEDMDSWIRPTGHPDAEPGNFLTRHTYYVHHLVVFAPEQKLYFAQHIGDTPFYMNPFFSIAEKIGTQITAVKTVEGWHAAAKQKGIKLSGLKFDPEKIQTAIAEMENAKAEFEAKAVKEFRRARGAWADGNAFMRLTWPEMERMLQAQKV